jgi:hypothetical protein
MSLPRPRSRSSLSSAGQAIVSGSPSEMARRLLDRHSDTSFVAPNPISSEGRQTAAAQRRAELERAEAKIEEERRRAAKEKEFEAKQKEAEARRVRALQTRREQKISPTIRGAMGPALDTSKEGDSDLLKAGDGVLRNLDRVEVDVPNVLRAMGKETLKGPALTYHLQPGRRTRSTSPATRSPSPLASVATSTSAAASPQPSPPVSPKSFTLAAVAPDVIAEAEVLPGETAAEAPSPPADVLSPVDTDEQAAKDAADAKVVADFMAAVDEGVGDALGEMSSFSEISPVAVAQAAEVVRVVDDAQLRRDVEALMATRGDGQASADTDAVARAFFELEGNAEVDPSPTALETDLAVADRLTPSEPERPESDAAHPIATTESKQQPDAAAVDDSSLTALDTGAAVDHQPEPYGVAEDAAQEPVVLTAAKPAREPDEATDLREDDAAPIGSTGLTDGVDGADGYEGDGEDNDVRFDEDDDLDLPDNASQAAKVTADMRQKRADVSRAAPVAREAVEQVSQAPFVPVLDRVRNDGDMRVEEIDEDEDMEDVSDFRHSFDQHLTPEVLLAGGVPEDVVAEIAASQDPERTVQALEGFAARRPDQLVFISNPEEASVAFGSVAEVLGGDDSLEQKSEIIRALAESCPDTALQFYADMVCATLEQGDPLTEEQRRQGIDTLRDKFSFLASDDPRTPEESCDATVEAFSATHQAVHDNLKPVIAAAFQASSQSLLKKSQEFLAGPQAETVVDESANPAVATPRSAVHMPSAVDDEEEQEDVEKDAPDDSKATQGNSSDVTFKNKGNWKQGLIVGGKGAVAITIAALFPGFGFVLAMLFLIATKNIGADKKEEHVMNESLDGASAQPDHLSKMLQDMDNEAPTAAAAAPKAKDEEEEEKESKESPLAKPEAAPASTKVEGAALDTTLALEAPPALGNKHARGAVAAATAHLTEDLLTTLDDQEAKLESAQKILQSSSVGKVAAEHDSSLHSADASLVTSATSGAATTPTDTGTPTAPVASSLTAAVETPSRDSDSVLPIASGEVGDDRGGTAHRSVVLSKTERDELRTSLGGVGGFGEFQGHPKPPHVPAMQRVGGTEVAAG